MANKQDVLTSLIFMDESSMAGVIEAAFIDYANFLAEIYNDIYDSCIQLYYSTYTPEWYDRHGDLSGFNLYSAADIYSAVDSITISWDGYKLLPYRGKEDKREIVLERVLDGVRGVGSYKNRGAGWPRDWHAYYPNQYSKKNEWSSSATTLRSILQDFGKNGVDDTTDVFYDFLGRYM